MDWNNDTPDSWPDQTIAQQLKARRARVRFIGRILMAIALGLVIAILLTSCGEEDLATDDSSDNKSDLVEGDFETSGVGNAELINPNTKGYRPIMAFCKGDHLFLIPWGGTTGDNGQNVTYVTDGCLDSDGQLPW